MSICQAVFPFRLTDASPSKPANSPARPTVPCWSRWATPWCWSPPCARKDAAARPRLLPADRQLPGKDLRRGPHPGRLLPPRGPPERRRDADLAPDRPPDPPAVPGWLLQRSAGRRHGDVAGPGHPGRHPGADRRLRRAVHVRRAVQGPDRRRARRLQGRQVHAESDPRAARRTRSWTWSSPAPQHGVLMVESEAQACPKRSCSAPWCFGHEQMQVAIQAISELAAQAGKPRWAWTAPAVDAELVQCRDAAAPRRTLSEAYRITEKQERYTTRGRDQDRRDRPPCRRRMASPSVHQGQVGDAAAQPREPHRSRAHPERRAAHRRPRHQDRAPDHHQGRLAAAHPRLGAVHPRRDPGAGHRDAGHRARCADHRRAGRRAPRAVHAALQLPAVLGGRDRHDGFAQAPRDRPRQPGAPRHRRRAAGRWQSSPT